MTVTTQTFRGHYPPFVDTTNFPEAGIIFWLGVATRLINAVRFSTLADDATELFIAHHLTLEKQSNDAVLVGGNPGDGTGIVASDSVDKASISYDSAGSLEEDAGHWNMTIYGKRFIALARMAGSGGLQL